MPAHEELTLDPIDRRATLPVLSALFLAACGGGGGSDKPTSGAPSPAPSPTPSPSPSPSPNPSPAPGTVVYGDFRAAALGAGAALNGALVFPSDNDWNRDISGGPDDPNSDALIASIGNAVGLDPDFGAGEYAGRPIGVPSVVVAGSQARVTINWTDCGDESDPGPYPVPADAPIEGGSGSSGDRQVIVIDRANNRLHELAGA